MGRPLFAVHNHHHENCGAAPYIQDINKNEYLAYYENEHGEQWIFVYNRTVKTGLVYCGDAGWDHPYNVVRGYCPELVTNGLEQRWIALCWETATK